MAVCVDVHYPVPDVLPISELRQRQNEILARLRDGPIVLTQHGKSAAVLISPEEWNNLLDELDELRDCLIAAERREEYRRDSSTVRSLEEVETELKSRGLLDE